MRYESFYSWLLIRSVGYFYCLIYSTFTVAAGNSPFLENYSICFHPIFTSNFAMIWFSNPSLTSNIYLFIHFNCISLREFQDANIPAIVQPKLDYRTKLRKYITQIRIGDFNPSQDHTYFFCVLKSTLKLITR